MKKKTLSNKEIRELNDSIKKYNFQFDKKEKIEIVEGDKYKVIKANNETLFFYLNAKYQYYFQ